MNVLAFIRGAFDEKQSGKPIAMPERREPARVINLMDALRRSVEAEKKTPARSDASPAAERADRGKKHGTRRKTG
jgi:non-homologous end joining protein Ku